MRRLQRALLAAAVLPASLLIVTQVLALEVPKPVASPDVTPAAPTISVEATDETAFYQQLQRVTQHRTLRGLNVSDAVLDALAKGNAEVAVLSLSKLAASDDALATIALVRIQNGCGRIGSARAADTQAQLQKLSTELTAERMARVAGVLAAEAQFLKAARESCARAQFDYGGIESQLRRFAAEGHAASVTELAQFTRDAVKRNEMLQTAASKNFAPAMYALATARLSAVQRGETTENVSSIRELLKQAGRSLPKAKLDLANCMALGCDGHPSDSAAASAFGLDAARDGEPAAYVSMVRMPWGGRFNRADLLAWQYFGERLNEEGCMGDGYIMNAVMFSQAIKALEKGLDEKNLQQARSRAEDLWKENAPRAKKEQGCG